MNIEEYKRQCIIFLLTIINNILLKHNRTVNRARMNGNWIDWVYDDKTDTFKRLN